MDRRKMLLNILIGFLLNLILIYQKFEPIAADHSFSFPQDQDQNEANRNLLNRPPVTNVRCKEGEFLYPGDQGDDWVCDCKPGYIYYPIHDRCYAAYRKGPCKEHQYLVLPKSKVIPECQQNACDDGSVIYEEKCHELNKAGPCIWGDALKNLLEINETSLSVGCSLGKTREEILNNYAKKQILENAYIIVNPAKVENRIGEPVESPQPPQPVYPIIDICFNGGKRHKNNACPDYATNNALNEINITAPVKLHEIKS